MLYSDHFNSSFEYPPIPTIYIFLGRPHKNGVTATYDLC
jgi:hypothetical protein